MLPILNIGPLALQTPGLVLMVGLWLGWLLAGKMFHKFRVEPALANNLVFAGLAALAIGGRLAYAVEHLSIFAKSPSSLFSLNVALWDLPGGILAGVLVVGVIGARSQVRWGSFLDALTPLFGVLMAAVSLADLASGNGYGETARLPWSIYLWGDWRHPTQIYGLLAALIILDMIVLLPLSRVSEDASSKPTGLLFLKFTAWSAAAEVFIGAFRADVPLIAGQVRAMQVYAWLFLAACLILIERRKRGFTHEP